MNLNRCPCGAEVTVEREWCDGVFGYYIACYCGIRQRGITRLADAAEMWNAWTSRIAANQWQRVTDTEPGDGEQVVVTHGGRIAVAVRNYWGWGGHCTTPTPTVFFRVPPCPDELKGEQ